MRAPIVVAVLAAVVSWPSARAHADVVFADPADPVFRALYPAIDPRTGVTPVAEPAVAAGRAPARPGRERCAPGFRIAEPRLAKWPAGGAAASVALFQVTTDNPPGVPAPCYVPEPWLCVLEKNGDAWAPVDCAPVPRDVFPEEMSIDTAAFRLNDGETAVGARVGGEASTRTFTWTDEALVLFRLHERRLSQVLALTVAREETDEETATGCSRRLVLRVEPTRTNGFFDWRVTTSRRPARRADCPIDPDPTGLYRWSGDRYIKKIE